MNIDKYFQALADIGNSILFFDILFFTDKAKFPFLIFWLLAGSFYFSFITNFLNFRKLSTAFKMFFKDKKYVNYTNNTASTKSIVLSATGGAVDLGTIFGVAAITVLGGPGSIFWLLLTGIISTSLRFAEVMIGHKMRDKIYSNGKLVGYTGGPQVYIEKIFKINKMPKIGKIIAKIFAFNVMISTFCSLQINQSVQVITYTMPSTSPYTWVISLMVSVCVIFIVARGITSVAKFSGKFVPIMIYLYVGCTIYIILVHYQNFFPSIGVIINDAFSFKAASGGIFGSIILGVQRAFFCNEAGSGAGGIIHANSTNKDSYKEGLMGMITPLISVLLVCFCSGLIVTVTGVYSLYADRQDWGGIEFVIAAFETIHPNMKYFTLIVVPLFGVTTAISWAYYGTQSFISLFGKKNVVIYYLMLLCAYFLSGIVKKFDTILALADILNLSITIPNMIALFFMSKFIRKTSTSRK